MTTTAGAAPPCGHCGRTSHGFACCGLLFAEIGEECPWDHSAALGVKRSAANVGQSGPAQPKRPPRAINPHGAR